MNYQEVKAWLEALQMHKIKLGLDAMQQFLGRVENPEKGLAFVHIAGTNGKGTVCAALQEILCRSGYRVGVYTSPHLVSVRERFQINGKCIDEAAFARLGSRIVEVLGDEKITYFEFVTALGLLWFAESEVDLVLLETGMGGRLDATNVVTPLVSVITSISMDHEAWLGSSLNEIAAEKAGIIKPGVPVVSAAAGIAAEVIDGTAKAQSAPLYRLHREFDYTLTGDGSWSWQGEDGFARTISGLHSNSVSLAQQENESLALAVLSLLAAHGFRVADVQICQGLAALVWRGRMELLEIEKHGKKYRILLDGAHNPAGVANLAATLEKHFPGQHVAIWGSMVDKDLGSMLNAISRLFKHLILTRPRGDRSASPQTILAALPEIARKKAVCEPEVEKALQQALYLTKENGLIVICGSLYLIGEILALFHCENTA